MRFIGDVNGTGAVWVDADDAEDGARTLAQREYERGDGSLPPGNEYVVSMMSVPDGAISTHVVTIHFDPWFSIGDSDEEPDEDIIDSLIVEASRE